MTNQNIIPMISLTQAYQAQAMLSRNHIPSSVRPTPFAMRQKGCGYSVYVHHEVEMARILLRQAGIIE